MNRIFALFFVIFTAASMQAQIHEIGAFLGGSNYIGDVGPTDYIAPSEAAFGILYKWNKSPRHAWRFSYNQSRITSRDADSKIPARIARGFSFKNDLKEVSAGLEFNFFDFNLHTENEVKVTPYIYSGLSYVHYDELFYTDKEARYARQRGSLAIPIVVGIKGRLARHLILGVESGARFSFTDNLDGSNSTDENLKGLAFGNLKSKDWYVFTGVTLTYTFGNKPCYCTD